MRLFDPESFADLPILLRPIAFWLATIWHGRPLLASLPCPGAFAGDIKSLPHHSSATPIDRIPLSTHETDRRK